MVKKIEQNSRRVLKIVENIAYKKYKLLGISTTVLIKIVKFHQTQIKKMSLLHWMLFKNGRSKIGLLKKSNFFCVFIALFVMLKMFAEKM